MYIRVRCDVTVFAKTHGSILRTLVQVVRSIKSVLTASDTLGNCRRRYATLVVCFHINREPPVAADLDKMTELA